jgi:hypothetical protein
LIVVLLLPAGELDQAYSYPATVGVAGNRVLITGRYNRLGCTNKA